MKKFLISLLLGVSMVTMVGCGNNNKEVANTNVEENEREGAYPNFQDKETEEPIGLSKGDREEIAIEEANNVLSYNNKDFNSGNSEVEVITFCYIYDGTIHVYNFMDYGKSTKYTNEEMAMAVAEFYDEDALNTTLRIAKSIIKNVRASFKFHELNVDDYEIIFHDCIGNPNDETFYEIVVADGDGNVIELLGEKVN